MEITCKIVIFTIFLFAKFENLEANRNGGKLFLSPQFWQADQSPSGDPIYDFIVVGGGTGACAVAGRLSESGRYSVLLIEAGGIPDPDLEIPALTANLTTDPIHIGVFLSVPQPNAGQSQNGIIPYIHGRTLGGSSAVNGMFLNRGHPEDYNNWARLTNDSSWNYQNLLRYFRNYETYTGPNPTDQRGLSGPITVSLPRFTPGLAQWLRGGAQLNYSISYPNAPQSEGFSFVEYSQRNGRRVNSFKGYIAPKLLTPPPNAKSRQGNLHILINTDVDRILLEGNRAVGVRFKSNSTGTVSPGMARARREVIVAAGVIGSPTLLMRSGIGPKPVLDSANITVVKDLPVGRNFVDHVVILNRIIFGNGSAVLDEARDLTPEARQLYNQTGTGPFSSYIGTSGQAFLTSSVLPPNEKALGWPDFHLIPLHSVVPAAFINSSGGEPMNDLREGEYPIQWSVLLTRPKSRGNITLNSTNIDGPPILDPRYLTHPDDAKVLIDGIKVLLRLCEETEALKSIGCRVPSTPLPACSNFTIRSDPYWECYVRQLSTSGLHAGGTCRMGGPNDASAVVDTQLKVIGIEGLRVTDASIMPAVTNVNTQGAVYVIAEKAADMILRRWGTGTTNPGGNSWGFKNQFPKHFQWGKGQWKL